MRAVLVLMLLQAAMALQLHPRFSRPQADSVQRGAYQLQQLEESADKEGFLAAMFGTDCYSKGVAQLKDGCRGMDQTAALELSFAMMNCHLAKSGRTTYPCPPRHPLHSCTATLPSDIFGIFTSFNHNVHR